MTRFFVRPDQFSRDILTLDADDAHHLKVVLHANPGDRIAALDGSGRECDVVLTEVGKTRAVGTVRSQRILSTECRPRITVAQALPKMADKMEQVLQRGTEAGASAFWAFSCTRSLTHFEGDRQNKRIQRWNAIVKTAAEQSHRAILPRVRVDQTFADLPQAAGDFDLALIAFEGEAEVDLRNAVESRATPPRSILVVIGPEGGFTDSEVKSARKAGMISVSLGPRILRTETAALVIVSQLVYALDTYPLPPP